MGKKLKLLKQKRSEIVTLHNVGFYEREISSMLHVRNTDAYEAVSKFKISGKFTDFKLWWLWKKQYMWWLCDKKDGRKISKILCILQDLLNSPMWSYAQSQFWFFCGSVPLFYFCTEEVLLYSWNYCLFFT